ncbi:MAG: hypothetical protein H0V83_15535 [Rubrobacter sp.]|nr:hypothetical protein [Rubrobacter sp.]
MQDADHKPDNPYTAIESHVVYEGETIASTLKTREPSGEFDEAAHEHFGNP